MNYYNEHDKNAAAWLEELVAAGDLPPGIVDSRDVQAVGADDLLHQYDQCHLFAGIGGWPHALDLAGWSRDKPIWSASLPCQPFSDAGKQLGVDDDRHLWPVFRGLVAHYRPQYVIGEQVASKAGRAWFAALQLEMEDLGYWVGAVDLCAAGFGAPHIRQRLYWCAVRVADRNSEGLEKLRKQPARGELMATERGGEVGGLADSNRSGREEHTQKDIDQRRQDGQSPERDDSLRRGDHGRNPWGNVIAVPCADGKSRLLESCSEPLVDGFPAQLVRGSDPGAPPDQGNEEAETQAVGWTTPRAADPKTGHHYTANMTGEALSMDASLCGWPTPNTSEGGLTSRSGARKGELLVGGIARSMPDPGPRVAFPPLVTQQTGDLNNTNEARTMRLRGYGNAIIAPLAAEFIRAFMDILDDIGA